MKYLAHPRWTKSNIDKQKEEVFMNISHHCSFIYRPNRIYFFQFALKKYKHHLTKHSLFNTHVLLPTRKTPRRVFVWVTRGGSIFFYISIFMRWKIQKSISFWKHNAWPYLEIDHVGRQRSGWRWKYSHKSYNKNTPPPYCCDEISYDHAIIVFTSFTVCLFMYYS